MKAMRTYIYLLLLCLCLACPMRPALAADTPRPELRAFWADGFNPAFKSPQEVDLLLQRLHEAHCNAIFAQVRKGGDAYYASHYEPWAKDDTNHFDALAYLIQQAHALNPPIAVHAWINTCAVGGNGRNPFNIVHLHPDWLSLNPKNVDFDGEATKIDPGNPGAADWTFRVYLDVARHYNVDGIHFDFVRYGGKEWGYNPVSVARFRQQIGSKAKVQTLPGTETPDPADPLWKQWRRDQVTNLVRKVYVHAAQINPKLVVSAAVITWADSPKTEAEWYTKSAAMNRTYQDWRGWLQEGMIDLACPMTYFQADYHTNWQYDWSAYVKDHQYHRAATIAVGTWFNTISQSLELMANARQKSPGGHWPYGVMLYSYGGTNASDTKDAKGNRQELQYQPDFYAALSHPSATASTPPFTQDVPIPEMRWKSAPSQGHLKGFLLTPQLDGVDGAKVTVQGAGHTYTHRSDGTGFFAFIDLRPGDYAIRVDAPGYQPQKARIRIVAGKVTTQSFTLGGASVPLTPSLAALRAVTPTAANGTPVRLQNLLVTVGSDIFPGNLYVMDPAGPAMRIRLDQDPPMPFQAGDIVSVAGTLLPVEGERTLDKATVRLTDIAPESTLPVPAPTTIRKLIASDAMDGLPMRIQGRVVEASRDSFTVDDGDSAQVVLSGLKDFGVEAEHLSVTVPAVGTSVSVTGIVVGVTSADGKTRTIKLRPRRAEDVVVLPATAFWRSPLAQGGALLAFFQASWPGRSGVASMLPHVSGCKN